MPLPTPLFPETSSEDWERRERAEKARVLRIMAFAGSVSSIASLMCAAVTDAHGTKLVLFPLLGTPLGMAVVYALVVWLPDAASEGFMSFLWPNRGEAAARPTYSHVQAMAAAGNVAGALVEYEAIIAATPGAIEPRIQAAELYAQGTDPARAAKLFAEIRRVPGCARQHDLYATQRLVDLYDGPLAQPQKSLTELRRIVEVHRESREATFARQALVRRKREG